MPNLLKFMTLHPYRKATRSTAIDGLLGKPDASFASFRYFILQTNRKTFLTNKY